MLAPMTHEDVWLARVRAWRESGLSAKDYCPGKDFSAGALLSWSSRLGRAGKIAPSPSGRKSKTSAATPSVRFARVVASAMRSTSPVPTSAPAAPSKPHPSSMTITVGTTRIEVAPGFDPSMLRAVVDALGGSAR